MRDPAKPWTTRLDPKLEETFRAQPHVGCFEPPHLNPRRVTMCLLLPECEFQTMWLDGQGQPIGMVNRPPTNRNIEKWTRFVCERAGEAHAFLIVSCDTPKQLKQCANRIAALLPSYRRVALERMYEPQNRERGKLS